MPLTEKIPKPMAPFQGTTLIANQINSIKKSIENLHVTVGYKKGILSEHVISQNVKTIINTENKSNSWWIHNSLLSNFDQPILVMTSDNVTKLDLTLIENEYFKKDSPACMLVGVRPVKGLDGDYIFHDSNYKVIDIDRKKKSNIYCSGIQIINPYKVRKHTDSGGNFYSIWQQLISLNQLFLSSYIPDYWFSVDTLKQLENLTKTYSSFEK